MEDKGESSEGYSLTRLDRVTKDTSHGGEVGHQRHTDNT